MKPSLPAILRDKGLTDRFRALCGPRIPAGRVIEWLRRTTGVEFNSEQVKRNRQILDCPADRGIHRAKRGKAGPVTIRRARE